MYLILNSVVIILLSITIIFCWKLHSKISEIRSIKQTIIGLSQDIESILAVANNSIEQLQTATERSYCEIKLSISKAEEIGLDLSLLIDSGDRIAAKLDDRINLIKDILKNPQINLVNNCQEDEKEKNTEKSGGIILNSDSRNESNFANHNTEYNHTIITDSKNKLEQQQSFTLINDKIKDREFKLEEIIEKVKKLSHNHFKQQNKTKNDKIVHEDNTDKITRILSV